MHVQVHAELLRVELPGHLIDLPPPDDLAVALGYNALLEVAIVAPVLVVEAPALDAPAFVRVDRLLDGDQLLILALEGPELDFSLRSHVSCSSNQRRPALAQPPLLSARSVLRRAIAGASPRWWPAAPAACPAPRRVHLSRPRSDPPASAPRDGAKPPRPSRPRRTAPPLAPTASSPSPRPAPTRDRRRPAARAGARTCARPPRAASARRRAARPSAPPASRSPRPAVLRRARRPPD